MGKGLLTNKRVQKRWALVQFIAMFLAAVPAILGGLLMLLVSLGKQFVRSAAHLVEATVGVVLSAWWGWRKA